jgi:hypothetical protein
MFGEKVSAVPQLPTAMSARAPCVCVCVCVCVCMCVCVCVHYTNTHTHTRTHTHTHTHTRGTHARTHAQKPSRGLEKSASRMRTAKVLLVICPTKRRDFGSCACRASSKAASCTVTSSPQTPVMCMYVCHRVYVCKHVCMYDTYVCMYVCVYIRMYHTHACTYHPYVC